MCFRLLSLSLLGILLKSFLPWSSKFGPGLLFVHSVITWKLFWSRFNLVSFQLNILLISSDDLLFMALFTIWIVAWLVIWVVFIHPNCSNSICLCSSSLFRFLLLHAINLAALVWAACILLMFVSPVWDHNGATFSIWLFKVALAMYASCSKVV